MQYLMSRYGGHSFIFGGGRASDALLPDDQSVENMIDHYAKEIIPNYFFISSYDAKPIWMGSLDWSDFPRKPTKLGTLTHQFYEIFVQNDVIVQSDIYITDHIWPNVYAVVIKTKKQGLEDVIPDYDESYDYVLQVFIRTEQNEVNLFNRPKDIERILFILFYKMALTYEDSIKGFVPSRTYLGKSISKEFCQTITEALVDIDDDDKLSLLLRQLPVY